MLSSEEYIRKSIEYNLFWLRIMKEHAIFIEGGMPGTQASLAAQADQFKQQFERLLGETIRLANGVASKEILLSGQFYTRFTEAAEQLMQKFTAIEINRNLTRMTYNIEPANPNTPIGTQKEPEITALNQRILSQLNAFVRFKADLLNSQSSCQIFTFLYTADLEHILQEARRYVEIINGLLSKDDRERQNYIDFWNHNMSDHAKSMRGLFDPTEANNFNQADAFVKLYETILRNETRGTAETTGSDNLISARKLSVFKADTTARLIGCKAQALMPALYTDHLLREANHYIYLLQS